MTEPLKPPVRSSTMPTGAAHRVRHSIGGFEPNSNIIPQTSQETLFSHPSVRIVKFSPPAPAATATNPTLPDLDYPVDAVETLPWRIPTERVVAVGRMSLELRFSTTPFLKAGAVNQPLVKNCQAWCVDGQSVFVVRTGKLAYLRVELPYDTDTEKERVESFKQALSGIIRYEATPCPFKRGFSVEIPEEAKTPRKKKAWKPKHAPLPRLERLDFGASRHSRDEGDAASDFGSVADEESDETSSQTSGPHASRPSTADFHSSSPIPIPGRPASRAVSEPARSFESLLAKFELAADHGSDVVVGASPASSVDSFYSFQDTVSGSLFSPPYMTPAPSIRPSHSADDLYIPSYTRHHREQSEVTVTAIQDISPPSPHVERAPTPPSTLSPSAAVWSNISSASQRRGYPSESMEVEEPRPDPRLRQPLARRELSPLPPAAALFIPSRSPVERSLATAIIRKTCSLVFDTPVRLLFMLLRLAANIGTKRERVRRHSQYEESDEDIPLTPLSPDGRRSSSPEPQPPGAWSELD